MGCNCKKKIALEDEYGVKEREGIIGKSVRFLLKIAMFLILVALSVIVVPIMIFVIIYKLTLGKSTRIILPKFLGKYLK